MLLAGWLPKPKLLMLIGEGIGFGGRFVLSTWHHNDYRANEYIQSLWSNFSIITREHFYHVGGKEVNRNPVIEALVVNFNATDNMAHREKPVQYRLFETREKYSQRSLDEASGAIRGNGAT
ncbi:MAG: hypothetical protein ACOYMG_28600 [Candidatus Methylumidiphilus sp.]